jgi:hypothetical protein
MKIVCMERNPVKVEGSEQDSWTLVISAGVYKTVILFPIEGGGWETHKGDEITLDDIKHLMEKFLNEAGSILPQLNKSNEPRPTINPNMQFGAVKPNAKPTLIEKLRKLNLTLGKTI